MVKHTGEKPHACAFCPAAFSQKGNLQSHVQRVHSEVSPAQALGSRGPCGGGRWTRPGLVTTPGLQFASSRCSPAGPFQARRPSCTHECRWPGDMRTAWCWGRACICKRPPAGSTGSMDGERAPLTAPHRRRLGGGRATAGLCLAPASLLAVPQPVRQPRPAKSQELKAGFSREPVWAQKARWGFSCSDSVLA